MLDTRVEGDGIAMPDMRAIEALAPSCQTPFYLFDEGAVAKRIAHLRCFLPARAHICYAMKANPFILKCAARACDFVEACSPGELEICRALGIPPEKIVVSGVYKEPANMRDIVRSGAKVHRFTIESPAQFDLLESIARDEGTIIPVILRLTSGNQFGMDAGDLELIARKCAVSRYVECRGIQFFSGTQKTQKKIAREIEMLDSFMAEFSKDCGCDAPELEYGPGIPIDYCEQDAHRAESTDRDFLELLGEKLAYMRFQGALTLEIGRGIAACSGVYVTRIVDVKRNRGRNYAIADGGKHQLVYYGQALALKPPACQTFPQRNSGDNASWAICGALCTANDIMVKQIDVDDLRVGDYVAFPNAGAYCMTEGMASFLSRDMPRIYLSDGTNPPKLVRDRIETSSFNTPMA